MKLPRWLQWRTDRELDEEIQSHLDSEIQDNLARGIPPEEARYSALRKIGNTTRLRERIREGDPRFVFTNLAKDVRYALRSLRRNPGFTAAAVLSLALAIGANTTLFSFSDALLLQPLDAPHSDRLVQVFASSPKYPFSPLSYREYTSYRDQNQSLEGLMAEGLRGFAVQNREGEQAGTVLGNLVSGNYFSVLGAVPAIGRTFLPDEDSPAAHEIVALVSYQKWQADFHSDPNIAGTRVKLNEQPVTIVGVLPPEFRGTGDFVRSDFYVPLAAAARLFPEDKLLTDPTDRNLKVFGRLKSRVGVRAAQAEFATLAEHIEKDSEADSQRSATVLSILSARIANDPDDMQLIVLLLAIAGVVLLAGCTNVANLLLGRASARVREITIRQSVGASRGRLIAQLLTESMVLAVLGAGLGLLLSWGAVHYMASIQISPDLPGSFPVRVDGRVLTYTLLAAVAAVVISGLWPAIRGTRVDLVTPSKGGARSFRGRNLLVATQTALAAILLVGATLFAKSFLTATSDNPGFRVENVLVMSFNHAAAGFKGPSMRTTYQEIETHVAALPGVTSAALGSHLPMGSSSQFNAVTPQGGDANRQETTSVMFDRVEPGYFATMAVPILAGRNFDDGDKPGAPAVAIVNEALARRYWPDGSATGKRLRFGDGPKAPVLTVVGIAGNGKYQAALDKYEPYLYVPFRQLPLVGMTLFVHTAGNPATVAPELRRAVQAVAPDLPVSGMFTMKEIFQVHGLLGARLMAQMVGVAGVIGLALGVVGVYAVTAFVVTRRTRELGIRMALGATSTSVLRGVLVSGTKVALAGIAVGLAGALALTRYFADFLDRTSPRDPVVFAGVAILLLAVALAACWAPARRASRVNPAVTLRYE